MEKNQKVMFECFHDGLCSFWQLDENRRPVLLVDGVRFQRRVVGSKRNFVAEQAGHNIEMLIRIPRTNLIMRGCFAVIRGQQYKIIQVQEIPNTIPPCTDLTLAQSDLLLSFDVQEAGSGGRI